MRLLLPLLLLGCGRDLGRDLPLGDEADGVVLIVHGGGDDPSVWAEDLVPVVQGVLIEPERWTVLALDWSADADTLVTAARRGRRVGEDTAPQLQELDRVHVIAHSVGAHVAHGLATSLDGPTVQLTLLDPFVGSGTVRWGYGRDRFGEGADFACAYLNRDDGVPSTDGLLDQAHIVDVTAVRPGALSTSEQGHRWPITWYAQSEGTGLGLDLAVGAGGEALWDGLDPGRVTVLP